MEDALLFFDAQRYRLHAWVIMPNHVHALVTPRCGLGTCGHSRFVEVVYLKEANKVLHRSGQFWKKNISIGSSATQKCSDP